MARLDDDIADPRTYADLARIDEIFTTLRRDDPVHWTAPEGYRPFWTITKHADILEVSRRHDVFISEPRMTLLTSAQEGAIVKLTGGRRHLIRSLIRIDDPLHAALRGLTQEWFLPANVRKLTPRVEAIAQELIDGMEARDGACDFVHDVAKWFPLRVILSILGLPPEDEPRMMRLTQELFGPQDPDTQRSKDQLTFAETVVEFEDYFRKLSEARRAEPRDDVATVIANATIDGAPIGDWEANGYYITIAAAGHDTTSSTLAGGVLALVQHPDQMQRLREDPSLVKKAVEEMIRWVTPIRHMMRTAVQDVELRGRTIRAGDSLLLSYPSGNRDDEMFDDPFAFRIDRFPNRHLAFGFGAHQCLGMALARLELVTFLQLLLPRLDSIALAEPPAWVKTNFVQGMKTMPIRYQLAPKPVGVN